LNLLDHITLLFVEIVYERWMNGILLPTYKTMMAARILDDGLIY